MSLMFHTTVLIQQTTQTSITPAGFEPTIPASERPQTHASGRAATEIGVFDPRTVQPQVSGYVDCAIPADFVVKYPDRNVGMDGREMDLTGNRIGECGRRVAQDTDR